MIEKTLLGAFVRLLAVSGCALVSTSGCLWQQSEYTTKMEHGFATYAARAELSRLLGDPFQPAGEFSIIVRPFKPVEPKGVPEDRKDLVVWCQGGEPLTELVIMGSGGAEPMSEFRRTAFANLQTGHGGPAQADFQEGQPLELDSLYAGAGKLTFENWSIQTQRPVAGPPGAPPTQAFNFLVYFLEDAPQKVMLAVIVPDSKYAELYPAITRCLQSVAIGGKVPIAQGGGVRP